MTRRQTSSKPNEQAGVRGGRSLVHDLRNRLATIKIAVQTLGIGETLTERGQRRVALAQREVDQLEGLLDALSDFFDAEEAT
ncbi:MAG TPA: histidine kinase dimerization/phospho-acceptor domain-containing protein [Myxococcales bacterium]|nr:histidine kinase dimerization/phospho-acceptor domain-containing protein [Myxococcales bacterium]